MGTQQQQLWRASERCSYCCKMFVAVAVVLVAIFDISSCMMFQSRTSHDPSCLHGFTRQQLEELTSDMANSSYLYDELLANILVPRVSGTVGNTVVREYIKSEMASLQWTVQEDRFVAMTPLGLVPFSNIVATQNPGAGRRIVLACHYDSKYMPNSRPAFVGAIDSAVPCSVMIDTARKLNDALRQAQSLGLNDLTLQLIFFDGEEAFQRWTATDSLYGSRHLAEKWQRQPDTNDASGINNLENIEVFVLMDLIGNGRTRFVNYYGNTSSLFNHMYYIERCLQRSSMLTSGRRPRIFDPWGQAMHVEDDHTPFIQKGVKVLHLISTPFPAVWHTPYDTLQYVDRRLVDDFSRILRVFITLVLFGL